MKHKFKIILIITVLIPIGYLTFRTAKKINPNPILKVGQKLDSLNGVYVYYNGGVAHIEERNVSHDGYNIGLKYQCVEFVKRYYYEHYKHEMPDSYGNAKDFFDPSVKDGVVNKKRNLVQFTNRSCTKPQTGDLIIFDKNSVNSYGHVAIISKVGENKIEIIQQNPGPFAPSRDRFELNCENGFYVIGRSTTLGRLRMR